MSAESCLHRNFQGDVDIVRLEDSGQFQCDLRVRCLDCDTPFRFLGLPMGLNLYGAACSFDGLEARLALAPGPAPIATSGKAEFKIGQ